MSANPGVSRMRTYGRGHTSFTSTNAGTYHYTILAAKFVQAGRVGLALVVRTSSLIGVVEDAEVVMTNSVAGEDIGHEFQYRGLSDSSLSNKKDGV